jgi:hypothetical protein
MLENPHTPFIGTHHPNFIALFRNAQIGFHKEMSSPLEIPDSALQTPRSVETPKSA